MNEEASDFQNEVIKRSHDVPVLVDFWAEWCGPCKVLGPVLERLVEKSNGQWLLVKVNTDIHQDLAAEYGVRGIPSVKLFVDGKVTNEFTGALPEQAVAQWLKKALPDRFRKEMQLAEQMLQEDKKEEAQSLLEGILQQEPGHEHSRMVLARSLVITDLERAAKIVTEIEPDSEHFPMAEAIRTMNSFASRLRDSETLPEDPVKPEYLSALRQLAASSYDKAVAAFIVVIRTNRYYDDDGARKACVAIFRILGDDHEVTRTWRREFSSALYA